MSTLKVKLKLKSRRDVELFFERMIRMHLVEIGSFSLLEYIEDSVSRNMRHVYSGDKVSFHFSLNGCFYHLDYKHDGECVTFVGEKINK